MFLFGFSNRLDLFFIAMNKKLMVYYFSYISLENKINMYVREHTFQNKV